jgi:hypothetical protein
MSPPNQPDILPYEAEFLAAFGHMIISWNEAESALRRLLAGLCGAKSVADILKAKIVTIELGPIGLGNALQTFADIILPPTPAEAVKHAIKYYQRVLAYRNYYVHGITSVIPASDGPRGLILITTAKGTLTENRDIVSLNHIKSVTGHANQLHSYVEAVISHLLSDEGLCSLPHKPPLPDKIQKTRQHLREHFAPHEESQE